MSDAYAALEPALAFLAPYGPDLQNGMTNHAPMAVEALCALGRGDAVMPWLERYRVELLPRPIARDRIPEATWADALGRTDWTAEWTAFFADALAEAPWRQVLAVWSARLAPGICASATHGVLRAGHAARALGDAESPARRHELAEGLGYWAANYQTLPTAAGGAPYGVGARDAMARVRVMPEETRRFTGTIVSSLEALAGFPAFASVIDLLDTGAEPVGVLSDLTEVFARVYLANARDFLTTIVFVHGVTSLAAVRSLLPVLDPPTARHVIRYAWQSSAALYAAFGTQPAREGEIDPPREDRDTLVDLAIANGDEHAIKFTEACLREHALHPSPAYLAAARHAIGMLVAG